MHMSYLSETARLLKEQNIHICLETCGFYDQERFEKELLPYLDLVYFDIKLYDRAQHERYSGASNEVILSNLHKLFGSHSVRVVPRIPLIPGITMEEDNLLAIRSLFIDCGVKEIGLLPYNPLWLSKPKTLGISIEYDRSNWLDQEEKDKVKAIFQGFVYRNF